ncbi:MAG TPA: hypothetical protein VII62_04985 [Vicinamibacteria bacterium]|jgi:hypothetical protein
MSQETSAGKLILVPAVITLAVTLLRLVGELQGWSPALFNREAGGGGALVGISWLVPIFGAWFGWKLAKAGSSPGRIGPALLIAILAFALMPGLGFGAIKAANLNPQSFTAFGLFVVLAFAGLALGLRAWPALGKVLLQYALAARVPVILVMLVAMLGNWGTHYDVPPPNFPEMGTLAKWFAIGVVPQLSIWIWYTVVVGMIFGIAAAAVAGRRPATA